MQPKIAQGYDPELERQLVALGQPADKARKMAIFWGLLRGKTLEFQKERVVGFPCGNHHLIDRFFPFPSNQPLLFKIDFNPALLRLLSGHNCLCNLLRLAVKAADVSVRVGAAKANVEKEFRAEKTKTAQAQRVM